MTVSDKDFKNLTERVKAVEEKANPWPATIAIIAVLVTLFGLGLLVLHRIDDRVTHLDDRISDPKTGIAKHLDSVEAAVKVIGSQQSEKIQDLVYKLLATAQTSDPIVAAKATLLAASLTTILRKEKREAPAEFFTTSVKALNAIAPKAGSEVSVARLALADYSSAIYHPSNLAAIFAPGSTQALTVEDVANLSPNQENIKGFRVYPKSLPWEISPPPATVSIFGDRASILLNLYPGDAFTARGSLTDGLRSVSGLVVATKSQTLDGFAWSDIVFINARIQYRGGPVLLKNVRFVNCTFDTPSEHRKSSHAQQFLDYAALAQPSLSVG